LKLFAASLEKAFYGFEPDFFQQNLLRIVDDVVSVIKGSIELWPTLVEICYFQKNRKGLPQVRIGSRVNGNGHSTGPIESRGTSFHTAQAGSRQEP
jgi:hypothetical protein